jgi:hypothetical protein
MKKLIDLGKAPRNASMPHSLLTQRLWDLDVDDPIWDDPALYYGDEDPPLWMYDPVFKAGIRAVIQLDRCEEEDERLKAEMDAFVGWIANRFDILNQAWYDSAGR